MKDIWYSDNRDLVKWGILIRLAELYGVRRILQVAYYRPSVWQTIKIDGQEHQISKNVISHFRDLRSILRLGVKGAQNVQIDVVDSTFENRETYLKEILRTVQHLRESPQIVFLDPDTGLECTKPTLKHVLEWELAQIWAAMRPNDILVLYQHQTNRNGAPWVGPKREQFENALGIGGGTAKTATGAAARDVAFFFAQKSA
jgi:hypothetical protein